jgi:hypothetical protein
LSLASGYVINGFNVFGVPFLNAIIERGPPPRDFPALWMPLSIGLNACVAALLPDLFIAFSRWRRKRSAK